VAQAATPVSHLQAAARDGQVFLTWQEAETPAGTTFNVYLSERPITDVTKAEKITQHVERHSARDWWEDPAALGKGEPRPPVGFLIQENGPRLDPAGGLFVHTARPDRAGRLHFAITCTDPDGREDTQLAAGANSLAEGVAATPGAIRPIWQRSGPPHPPGAGRGKALGISLHGKSGVVPDMEYLFFGDRTMGWREGLAVKFSVRVAGDEVVIRPTDRTWINRPHPDGAGGSAIWSFWYGYNSEIYDRQRMGQGVPTNYTERRNLWILEWVGRHYETDPKRCYCSGSSMGGCGTISFGLRHPELFAALHAHVPIVSYTHLGTDSARRLEAACWIGPLTEEVKTNEGLPLLDRMNGTKFVRESDADLPPLFVVHGRRDGSIPWENNPPFYRAMNEARQALAVYWDDGEHATAGKDAPADVKAWPQRFRQFRLDQSFPAFANTSSSRNPGRGKPDDGDTVGWINRGMAWRDIEDEPGHYAITILADYPGLEYPVRTDVTLRRVQHFKTAPGERLSVRRGDAPPVPIAADARGRVTIPQVVIPSQAGVRLTIHRAATR
jgi:dienelactone hydrolase